MSIDALARRAAADLHRQVAAAVDPAAERAQLQRFGRTQRARQAAGAGLLALAVVAGGFAVKDSSVVQRIQTIGVPRPDPRAMPLDQCIAAPECPTGSYRLALATPATLSLAAPGTRVVVDGRDATELGHVDPGDRLVVVDAPQAAGRGDLPGRSPSTPGDVVDRLRSRSDLVVSETRRVRLAGLPALQVDVAVRPAAPGGGAVDDRCGCVPLLASPSAQPGDPGVQGLLDPTERAVLTLAQVPGRGTVAVLVADSDGGDTVDASTLAWADPIVDSLAFGVR